MTEKDGLHLPSFWLGGYEGADHVNGSGEALDLVQASGHSQRLGFDYRYARRLGLRCVRESVGWRLSEAAGGGRWDFTRPLQMAQAASREGLHILWTLMHYGLPADLTLMDDALVPRFARFAGELARVLRGHSPAPRIYTPINEISFLAWAASATREMGPAGMPPGLDPLLSGFQMKCRLVRAALAGMAAMREVDPDCRFLHIEPVVHVVPQQPEDPDHQQLASDAERYQWQTLDLLAGRLEPALGGHEGALDWIGINHYHNSQWELPSGKHLTWHLRDPRRQPLAEILRRVWLRYRRPLLLAETSHVGVGRAAWLHEAATEVRQLLKEGVPVRGICLYPLLDRPDWNDTGRWHRSGLWHVPPPASQGLPRRCLNRPYARALRAWQQLGREVATAAAALKTRPLLVLLPCAWEDWHAPRESLLAAWQARGHVLLMEPPRADAASVSFRRYGLGPGAELLVLHVPRAGGWSLAPAAACREALQPLLNELSGGDYQVVGSEAVHPGWCQVLDGSGLRALAQLQAEPLRQDPARTAKSDSYEDEELQRLLAGIGEPRVWLRTPPSPLHLVDVPGWLMALAGQWPRLQILIDAAAPLRPPGIVMPNLHWRGRVHDSLHAALCTRVKAVLDWESTSVSGAAEHRASSPAAVRAAVGDPGCSAAIRFPFASWAISPATSVHG